MARHLIIHTATSLCDLAVARSSFPYFIERTHMAIVRITFQTSVCVETIGFRIEAAVFVLQDLFDLSLVA